MTTPPGWPRAVPDPESSHFPDKVVGWMLDLCPPEYRSHEVFRRHPVILARLAALHAEASLQAARAGYAGARRDLAARVPPEAVEETLVALSKEGARLAAQLREIALVEEALQGRRWRPKL
ncbi:MAG TPA: hypothetical protein VES03_08035 [Motilibacterales bacterium]|nr:hypothetical protein [Motilibacterales bacterium]